MLAFSFVLACSTYAWAHALLHSSGEQDILPRPNATETLGQLILSMASGVPVQRSDSKKFSRKRFWSNSARLSDRSPAQFSISGLSYSSVDLAPRAVVVKAMNALSMQQLRVWLTFLDQHAARRRVAWTSADPIIQKGFKFEILSHLRKSADRYVFRVRAFAPIPSGFFGTQGMVRSRDYAVVLGRENCFEIGRTVMHVQDYQIGMIIGREPFCKMDDGWIEEHGIDELPRGRLQPFYMVLPDSRSENPSKIQYVAEDLLLKADVEHLFQHPLKESFLGKDVQERLPREARSEVKGDIRNSQENTGCWLIHDVRNWD